MGIATSQLPSALPVQHVGVASCEVNLKIREVLWRSKFRIYLSGSTSQPGCADRQLRFALLNFSALHRVRDQLESQGWPAQARWRSLDAHPSFLSSPSSSLRSVRDRPQLKQPSSPTHPRVPNAAIAVVCW